MLPPTWRPIGSKDLVRLGPKGDGGYVVTQSVIDNTEVLFGFGLSDNWGFEEDFKTKSNCSVICYDHTVMRTFWILRIVEILISRPLLRREKIQELLKFRAFGRFFDGETATHHRIMIGYDGPGSQSIDSVMALSQGKRVFFKIDIEGWEYRVIDQLTRMSESVTGFVIEFHDIDLHRDRISKFISELSRFKLVHLHSNNCGGTDPHGDPIVVEMTFVRGDLIAPGDCCTLPIEGLDYLNHPAERDIPLVFERPSSG